MLATMLAILGGPFRLFEMLGLQQSFASNVAVTLLYLAVHPWAASYGIRCGCTSLLLPPVGVHAALGAQTGCDAALVTNVAAGPAPVPTP
jgi:hypothetical protein